jgi:hypothetical protein
MPNIPMSDKESLKIGQGKAGPGRPKGMPNKTTALLKDAILQAADNAHPDGLVGYLTQQAQDNPSPFLTLLGKVLPTQLEGDVKSTVELVVRYGGDKP